jgi:hypothetical protein
MDKEEFKQYKSFLDKMVEDELIEEYKFDLEGNNGRDEKKVIAVKIKPKKALDWVYMEFDQLEDTLPETAGL